MNRSPANDPLLSDDVPWEKWYGGRVCPLPAGTLVMVRYPDLGVFGPWPAQHLMWDMIDEYRVVDHGHA